MDFVCIQKETGRWRAPNGLERLVRHGSSQYFAPNELKIKFPSQSLPDRKRPEIIDFHQRPPANIENQLSIAKLINDDSVELLVKLRSGSAWRFNSHSYAFGSRAPKVYPEFRICGALWAIRRNLGVARSLSQSLYRLPE